MDSGYAEFLSSKAISDPATGILDIPELPDALFPFQRDIVSWALRRGRAAIFAGTGLGKTLMELAWCDAIRGQTGQDALILAPLAVSAQTVREAAKFGIMAKQCADGSEVEPGITITNYEKLAHFDIDRFGAVVLDESSILKSYDGKTRSYLIDAFHATPFRLAATATPAPNDYMELGNHAQFLGVISYAEMLATFFVHDGGETQKWRLKGHASADFWSWMASWSVMLKHPTDLGYAADGFDLPPLHKYEHRVPVDYGETTDALFPMEARTLQERLTARRDTVTQRTDRAAAIVAEKPDTPWIVWCNLNAESEALTKLIPDAVELRGSEKEAVKERKLVDFADGKIRVLVTKPSIAGFGLNWQHCANMIFVGLNDSFESIYQAERRCWRFGQDQDVHVHFVSAETEGAVVSNLKRKEADAERMAEAMIAHTKDLTAAVLHEQSTRRKEAYERDTVEGDAWTMHRGDCVDVVSEMDCDSIHYTVFSPPFASLYTYSASDRDMGNCKDAAEFFSHFRYLLDEIYRVTMPGRLMSMHCMDLPTSKIRDGYIGISDFSGRLIRACESAGWIYHSRVTIWKDPVTAMQRTKAIGLLHKQIRKDSTLSRQGIADYMLTFRRPGENPERVAHTHDDFPVDLWQRLASPVWMDINPSDTLQKGSAREHEDERHIAPLQLEVIRRCLKIWSNPGDLVLSPFAGIGSEGHIAIEQDRRFVGIELKRSYFEQACRNLERARTETMPLFADRDDAAD